MLGDAKLAEHLLAAVKAALDAALGATGVVDVKERQARAECRSGGGRR